MREREGNHRTHRNRIRKRIIHFIIVFILLILVVGIYVGKLLADRYWPTKERESLESHFGISSAEEAVILLQFEQIEDRAAVLNEHIYIPYSLVKDFFNDRFYWDSSVEQMVYTTAHEVFKIIPGENSYFIDEAVQNNDYPVLIQKEDNLYLEIAFVKELSNMKWEFYQNPNRVLIQYRWESATYADAEKDGVIRVKGGPKSPILADVKAGDKLLVKETLETYAKVQTQDGMTGYIKLSQIGETYDELLSNDFVEPVYPSITKDYKINLAFHQLGGKVDGSVLIENMRTVEATGVNTVAPTCMFLSGNQGEIESYLTQDYVDAAHEMGLEVWGLIENMKYKRSIDFNQIVSNMTSREQLLDNLMYLAKSYNLDGINIDFEEVESDAKEGYIQFLRELSIRCREERIVLSIDNYVPTAYTEHYNRKEQGIIADYIIIMGYDEHYAGSGEAGSTASIGFVENGIINTLKEVPAEKVINAIPFYTRVFIQTPEEVAEDKSRGILVEDSSSEFGRYLLESEAVRMQRAEELLSENGVEPVWIDALGQYYGEYMKDGRKYLIWLEEERSIGLKMNLIKQYELAGVAEWSLIMGKKSIWPVISDGLQ